MTRAKLAALVVLLAVTACSEDEPGGQGGAGGTGGTGGMAPTCLGCGDHRDACGPATGCPQRSELCGDNALLLLTALEDCFCQASTCAGLCANGCMQSGLPDPESCYSCQDDAAQSVCSAEAMACDDDRGG